MIEDLHCLVKFFYTWQIKELSLFVLKTFNMVSYCKFWIYWVGVNTKCTIWQLVNCVCIHPPIKLKILNDSGICGTWGLHTQPATCNVQLWQLTCMCSDEQAHESTSAHNLNKRFNVAFYCSLARLRFMSTCRPALCKNSIFIMYFTAVHKW